MLLRLLLLLFVEEPAAAAAAAAAVPAPPDSVLRMPPPAPLARDSVPRSFATADDERSILVATVRSSTFRSIELEVLLPEALDVPVGAGDVVLAARMNASRLLS